MSLLTPRYIGYIVTSLLKSAHLASYIGRFRYKLRDMCNATQFVTRKAFVTGISACLPEECNDVTDITACLGEA